MAPFILKPFLSLLGVVRAKSNEDLNVNVIDMSRGWGEDIDWKELKIARSYALAKGKPIMVIIHKSSCFACGHLKARFANATHVQEISKKFIMVNLDSEKREVPNDEDYSPDGRYFPRILFFSPDNKLIPYACNINNPNKHKYTYTDASQVFSVMKKVLDLKFQLKD